MYVQKHSHARNRQANAQLTNWKLTNNLRLEQSNRLRRTQYMLFTSPLSRLMSRTWWCTNWIWWIVQTRQLATPWSSGWNTGRWVGAWI